ncbi:hypothetical protein Zmor_014922 [Zophobas morio]|uniref:Integrase catalytic domain-containing protein n=1 Tax=Zophobas morio TaxID=2755281 RepID=A0AA38IKH8_9CUCU|nr:hypothetical protein Zmor_014922 [Zophobas morio]
MAHVDALSRAPERQENCVEEEIEDTIIESRMRVLNIAETDALVAIQRSDSRLRRLIHILQKGQADRTKEEADAVKNYKLVQNRLVVQLEVEGGTGLLSVIPDSMRKSMVNAPYVRRHIASCLECLLNKTPGGKRPGMLHPISAPKRPFERVHVDNLGPFVKTSSGCEHVMVVIDVFSRFVVLFALKATTSRSVVSKLQALFQQFGVCEVVVCDRGTCFTSRKFKGFCSERGVRVIYNSPRHPQGNGMVERVNRTILPVIKAEMQNERSWDKCLPKVQFNLNAAVNKTTRKSPFRVLYGYQPTLQNALVVKALGASEWQAPQESHEEIRANIQDGQQRYKYQFDKRRYAGVVYDVGEIVAIRSAPQHTGQSTKRQDKYKGPYVIVETLPADTYRIEKLIQPSERKQVTTAHVSQLKGYYNHEETEDEEEEEENEEGGEGSESAGVFEKAEYPSELSDESETIIEQSGPTEQARPQRNRRTPNKFQDFITDL